MVKFLSDNILGMPNHLKWPDKAGRYPNINILFSFIGKIKKEYTCGSVIRWIAGYVIYSGPKYMSKAILCQAAG